MLLVECGRTPSPSLLSVCSPCARIPKYVPQDLDVTAAPADLRANRSHWRPTALAHLGSKANEHFFPLSYAVAQTRMAVFLEGEIGHVSD